MSSRTWVKINCDRWFDGTIRKEPIEVRAIWTDILALAGRTGQDGTIRLPGTDLGYTDEQIASIFQVPLSIWLSAKERLRNHPMGPEENRIHINGGNVIEIINWSSYQSEYIRQLSYREKLQPKVTAESDVKSNREIRLDKIRLDLKDQEKNLGHKKRSSRFIIPTVEEISEYCEARGNAVDPHRFHAYYTANGWKVGKNPMKNWKAAIVTWERR